MSPSKETELPPLRALVGRLNFGIGLLSWRLMILIILALSYFEGRNILNAVIASSPATAANTIAIKEAQADVITAKAAADKANDKADQSLALGNRILDAVRSIHDDVNAMKLTAASSSATVTAQITSLGRQVDRIEAKQDASR